MEVGHRLARLRPAVGHHPEIGNALLPGHLGNDLKGVGHHGGVVRRNLPAGAEVGLGNHQEVGGRLGVDVLKGVDQLVLIDLVGRDLARRDLAEQTIAHKLPPLYRIGGSKRPRFFYSIPKPDKGQEVAAKEKISNFTQKPIDKPQVW